MAGSNDSTNTLAHARPGCDCDSNPDFAGQECPECSANPCHVEWHGDGSHTCAACERACLVSATYTVRPLGASAWSGPGLTLAQAKRDLREAADRLRDPVAIVCDVCSESLGHDEDDNTVCACGLVERAS